MKTTHLALAVFAATLLAACAGKAPAPAAVEAPPFKPVASIIDLMAGQIDPAADFMWESVATVINSKGTVERAPRNDKEWAEVRRQALLLIEGANLLMMEGRVVGRPGQPRENPPGQGDLTPEQSLAAINADRKRFNAFALALAETGEQALKAIDARDTDKFLEVGGDIDEACETCHKVFWYPGGGTPEPGK
jgi:hypothetical protein